MRFKFKHYPYESLAKLVSIDEMVFNPNLFKELVPILNSSEILPLFRGYSENGVIQVPAVTKYLDYAKSAWIKNENFVFFLMSGDDTIVGSIDLQRESSDTASLGFWQSPQSTGYMRNALSCLFENLHKFGYRSLDAYTSPQNIKAIKLFEDLNFQVVNTIKEKNLVKYSRQFS